MTISRLNIRLYCFALLLVVLTVWSLNAQSLRVVNTEPRVQLTGEDVQINAHGVYFTDTVPGKSLSQAGVLGTDLGIPVTFSDKILLLFGDTLGGYRREGRFTIMPEAGDSIGYLPNTDFSQCHLISNVVNQIAQGNTRPAMSVSGCPAIQFFLKSSPAANEAAFQPIRISGLEQGDGYGGFMTPSGGIVHNNRLYMFYKVQIQEAQPHIALKTIMVRSDSNISDWSQSNPPMFTRLYTVSSHAPFPNPAAPPSEENETGKFMFDPPVVMDQSTLSANAITPGLPAALQNAPRVVFVYGSSYRYNRSNLYLAAFNINDIERGPSAWHYYAGSPDGVPAWTNDERRAAPLIDGDPRIGNHTAMWNNTLRRFILMYGNIVASASATPWGPWTDPVNVLPPNGEWSTRLIHRSEGDPIKRTVTPIFTAGGAPTDINTHEIGIPYGPNLFEQSTTNTDGSVTLYYTFSAWNPYQVYLASTTFRIAPRPAPVVSAASYDGTILAAGSIATITGSGFSNTTDVARSASLPDELAGVNVTVQDSQGAMRKAQLYYVSPRQINLVIPPETALGPANINVMSGQTLRLPITATIGTLAPAIFSANSNGNGPAAGIVARIDSNGNLSSDLSFSCQAGAGACVNNPIDVRGSQSPVVELYGTGIRGRRSLQSVTATVGGVPVRVPYAGPHPLYPGMDQVNIELTPQLQGRGRVELVLLVDGKAVNTIDLTIR